MEKCHAPFRIQRADYICDWLEHVLSEYLVGTEVEWEKRIYDNWYVSRCWTWLEPIVYLVTYPITAVVNYEGPETNTTQAWCKICSKPSSPTPVPFISFVLKESYSFVIPSSLEGVTSFITYLYVFRSNMIHTLVLLFQ